MGSRLYNTVLRPHEPDTGPWKHRRLQQVESSAVALVLTRPPEIVSVLRIATDQSPVFVTFDSHPRQDHPEGAAFVLHNTLESAAAYLAELLKVDQSTAAYAIIMERSTESGGRRSFICVNSPASPNLRTSCYAAQGERRPPQRCKF